VVWRTCQPTSTASLSRHGADRTNFPNLVNEFHFDWLRHWCLDRAGRENSVIPNSLSDTPLQIWQESRANGMVPINVNTQQAASAFGMAGLHLERQLELD